VPRIAANFPWVMEMETSLGYVAYMRREEAIARLRNAEPALKGLGVAALYLFGSHARDEASEDSDIDVFVDPAPARLGFLEFMDAYEVIQNAFGHEVEIGYSTRAGLSPYVRPEVEREAIRIF
jgi:predicted nucleotidyltransferase